MAIRFRFGPYVLDAEARVLERAGQPVALRPKLVETLLVLVETAPGVVTKEALKERVWPDVNVVESSLARNVSELRSELSGSFPGQNAIETLPKRGYRFAPPVTREAQPGWRPPPASGRWGPLAAAAAIAAAALLAGWRWVGAEPAQLPSEESESVAREAFHSGFALYDVWTVEDMAAAELQFERSIEAAPGLWYGYYGSTMAQIGALALSGGGDPEAAERLLATADRAVELGPEAAVTHAARGSALLAASWDWDGAARAIEEGIRWNRENALPYERRALLATLSGRFDEARADYDRALERRRDFDDCMLARAFNEFCAGRYDEAVAGVLEALPQTRKQQPAHRLLAAALGAKGEWRAAAEAAEKAGLPEADRMRFEAWRRASEGDMAGARAIRGRLAAWCARQGLEPCDTVLVDTALGDLDAAFASLEEALRRRSFQALIHGVDPRLAPLRADGRWRAVALAIHGERR